jgi:hypothetical protein
MVGFGEFYQSLPLIGQVDAYHFYVRGYSEALRLFTGVRVVMSSEWLVGVPAELRDYFFKVQFPCYFVPVFSGRSCYGFVLKGHRKETPRFCTNFMLPGMERVVSGSIVILVEGFKDCYVPIKATSDLGAVVIPMLTSVPGTELLSYLSGLGCRVIFVPDNDEHRGDHVARFLTLCGKLSVKAPVVFDLSPGVGDFGNFFDCELRNFVLGDGKRLRGVVNANSCR